MEERCGAVLLAGLEKLLLLYRVGCCFVYGINPILLGA